MQIQENISVELKKAIKKLYKEEVEPQVSLSSGDKGDFSSNIAMILSKKNGNPMDIGQNIAAELHSNADFSSDFEKIEVAKPGFVNLHLSSRYIGDQITSMLDGKNKAAKSSKSEKVVVEFGDPNPFKEPHIGHLRIFVLGEALSRLMEHQGKKVVRASYQGDVGMHVGKAIYGILKMEGQMPQAEAGSIEAKAKFLGEAYAMGAKAYEEEDKAKEEIRSINLKIYQNDPEIKDIWEKGRAWSLEYFELLYKRLGLKYDKYYFESETAPLGKEIVEKNSPKIFEKHDGSYVFRGEPFGLHTRVFVTKEGYATYEGKDLSLAMLKKKDFPNTRSIIMTANEQAEYFKVILKALELLDKEIAQETSHLSFGFVNLKEGKMSSRRGNVIPAFWLLDETSKRLKEGFKEVEKDVLDALILGAVKWSMLKFSRESDIAFDFNESISTQGNSGPYMQYSYARTQSILSKKSEAKNIGSLEGQELALARLICQFETAVKGATSSFSPSILCNYLFELAQKFNTFYEGEKIIGSPKEEQRILITKAVGKTLKDGLTLLGIESPQRI